MRYAVIIGGIVENVILADPDFKLDGKLLVAHDEAGPGWAYNDGVFTPPVPPELPQPPAPRTLTRTYKADIWRRATDAEAETIDAALSSQSIRLQRMWSDALYLEATDDLYPTVQAAFTQFFGEARAAELLAPTE